MCASSAAARRSRRRHAPSPAIPIRLPALDIHTIGAGGGSIARLDPGGALVVGPGERGRRARARRATGAAAPTPTVTDADLVLGPDPGRRRVPRARPLDADAARRGARSRGRRPPRASSPVVDAAMERAVRVVTVEQGVDPRELALVAFGGAGPLHACAVADALGMRAVIVPPRAGVLSAVGLVSRAARDASSCGRGRPLRSTTVSTAALDGARATTRLGGRSGDGRASRRSSTAATRVRATSSRCGASTTSRRSTSGATGTRAPAPPIEVVAIRARRHAPPRSTIDRPPDGGPRRESSGPTVVAEPDCTVWVPDGWVAEPGRTRRVDRDARRDDGIASTRRRCRS